MKSRHLQYPPWRSVHDPDTRVGGAVLVPAAALAGPAVLPRERCAFFMSVLAPRAKFAPAKSLRGAGHTRAECGVRRCCESGPASGEGRRLTAKLRQRSPDVLTDGTSVAIVRNGRRAAMLFADFAISYLVFPFLFGIRSTDAFP